MEDKKKIKDKVIKSGLEVEYSQESLSYGHSRSIRYYVDGECLVSFNQVPFPNCCGIAIIKDLSMYSGLSKANFINMLNEFFMHLNKEDYFSKALFYTTESSFEAKMFSLYPNITILDPFQNYRTDHVIIGFEFDLLKFREQNKKSEDTPKSWPSITLETNDVESNNDSLNWDIATPISVQPMPNIEFQPQSISEMYSNVRTVGRVNTTNWATSNMYSTDIK